MPASLTKQQVGEILGGVQPDPDDQVVESVIHLYQKVRASLERFNLVHSSEVSSVAVHLTAIIVSQNSGSNIKVKS